MAKPPGRTYRYFTGKPLFAFGEGLSYTQFDVSCAGPAAKPTQGFPWHFTCTVKNVGSMAGDEVVLVFHSAGTAIRSAAHHPVPLKALCEFRRVSLAPGHSTTVDFSLPKEAFLLTNEDGIKTLYSGERSVIFSHGVGDDQAISITI